MEWTCENCGCEVSERDEPVMLAPYPHIVCPDCGEWIACF